VPDGKGAALTRIGLVGAGPMCRPKGRRMHAAGYPVSVLYLDSEATQGLAASGAVAAPSLALLAQAADIVLASVPGPREVEEVLAGPGGIIETARPGTLVVETITIGIAQGRRLAAACAGRNRPMLDAPVSGGTAGAADGTLVFTVGGDEAAFARAAPLFACLGQRAFHLGPSGSGYLAKAINQAVYLSYVAVFCEALGLGRDGGLDIDLLLEALKLSVAGQPLSTGWAERLKSGDRAAGFQVARVRKDLAAAIEAAALADYPLAMIAQAEAQYRDAEAGGHGLLDMSVLFDLQGRR
jgi:3-hydroxyisobutyrate dehydrogenase-like beta-hydroxyacid dehydrogenase